MTKRRLTIVVVGSGAGGTAIVEMLRQLHCDATVIVIDRGPLAFTFHIEAQRSTDDEAAEQRLRFDHRRGSIECLLEKPWDGDFSGVRTGWLVGGRVVFGGPNRSRMYPEDLNHAPWPFVAADLRPYYVEAERRLGVRLARGSGYAQTLFFNELRGCGAFPPPVEWETSRMPTRPSAASVTRLIRALLDDHAADERRLLIVPDTYVARLAVDGNTVTGVVCRSSDNPEQDRLLRADVVVLAAGAIESPRLVLNSGLGGVLPAAGRYLAEHVYLRGVFETPYPARTPHGEWINLRVPPRSGEATDRFEIEVRGHVKPRRGRARLRITGCAAVDPQPDNRVTLSERVDEFGVPIAYTRLRHSQADRRRVENMVVRMQEIVGNLGGGWVEELQEFPAGRSHHDAGTLRMGLDRATSVTDDVGRVHGLRNLRVADSSLLPGVGCVGPVLTVTALAYRVAQSIHVDIVGTPPDLPHGRSEAMDTLARTCGGTSPTHCV
jgi:choline dehydrogenase-like flavoprotein